MRIESPAFTESDLRSFIAEAVDHERQHLIERLEAASSRLAQLVQAGAGTNGQRTDSWSGHEVLAHIAVLSKFYGTLVYLIGSGKLAEMDWLEQARNRDTAGEQLSGVPAGALLEMAQRDHERTIAYLRRADATAMQRRAVLSESFSPTALEIATLGLCAHLELHLGQLERTLQP